MLVLRHPIDRKQPRVEIARAFDVVLSRTGGSAKPWERVRHPTPEEARAQYELRVAHFINQGYVRAGEEDSPVEVLQPELEAAIRQAPDDPTHYLVYADWLQTQGDPRGELIMLQHALSITGLEDGPLRVLVSPLRSGEKLRVMDARRLKSAHARLFREHSERFLGPSIRTRGKDERDELYLASGGWHFGFLKELSLEVRDSPSLNPELNDALRHPSARFVQRLDINLSITHDWGMLQRVLDTLAVHSPKPPLLELEIHSHSAARVATVEGLCAAYPRLRKLSVTSPIHLGRVRHAALESLGLHPSSFTTDGHDALRASDLPRLRHLHINDPQSAAPLETLLNGKAPSGLRELTFAPVRLTRELATAIANSRLLRQLEQVHFQGTFPEEGIAEMLRWRTTFQHLKRISVTSRAVGATTQLKDFKKLAPSVEITA